ncbi:L-threonylcarbamoyladenylate synthase [Methylobacterium nonmethylotrophicum]|uniref:Threonylcarbamoyl-AMP synthase n=1 Tax=Methylobacterium nonmethylotrophicum TaxID=1141884 RepID=A0A4Z0NXP4_9HYPH|nr:L-threonylcarbamoyladenylate synthase [Methylobacterium nonmethylotrophicum]TGE02728.1 threonylcarbamoyl-AMP synthase [Methylobacterium nonmethylotrophicum]
MPQAATRRLAADRAGIAEAGALLRAGKLVAIPTETVYGLGADAGNPAAVAGIYAAKERPRFNPLIAHLPDLAAAWREGQFGPDALKLAEAFWPGPLTLVVPAAEGGRVCDLARAGLPSVALRVPGSALARDILAAAGCPVAAPSANRSGRVSPTDADHVLGDLDGRISAILDGGPCPVGVESTIVACLDGRPVLLRPGGVSREAIQAVLGRPLAARGPAGAAPVSPGLLASHYAPRAAVRLDAVRIRPGEAALLFGPVPPEGIDEASAALNLSPGGDLAEAACHLFASLRRLDASGAATIAVAPIPGDGLGEAIRDRLVRAAAPR